MPTATSPTQQRKGPPNKILGFRLLVEPVSQDAIRESWLYLPQSHQPTVIQARVIQVGKYRKTKRRKGENLTEEQREGRGEIEVKAGDQVLISTDKGHVPIRVEDGNRKLRVVSYRDCLAIITESEPSSQVPSAR